MEVLLTEYNRQDRSGDMGCTRQHGNLGCDFQGCERPYLSQAIANDDGEPAKGVFVHALCMQLQPNLKQDAGLGQPRRTQALSASCLSIKSSYTYSNSSSIAALAVCLATHQPREHDTWERLA